MAVCASKSGTRGEASLAGDFLASLTGHASTSLKVPGCSIKIFPGYLKPTFSRGINPAENRSDRHHIFTITTNERLDKARSGHDLVALVRTYEGIPVTTKTTAFVANAKLIEALERRSQPVTGGIDCILFRQGETPRGVFILRSGEATLTMKSSGGDTLLQLRATAGSLLGLPGVIGGEPYTLTASVRGGSVVSFVSRKDFEALIREEPALSLGVCEVLAAEVRSARQALSDL
jgi:hypothetical protein